MMEGGCNIMQIEQNSRQMPSTASVAREKDYCDLLYAWLQCNSERENMNDIARRIHKSKVKWAAIERDFTRTLSDGTVDKVMSRKTIAKYFKYFEDKGLIQLNEADGFYYLTVLDPSEANLIEYNTLSKLMNVLQKNSISVYIYLFNRYYANGRSPFIATIKQIKDFIGIATTTTSNNIVIDDTLDILRRLGLLDYGLTIGDDNKTYLEFKWIKNKLPEC